MDYIINFLTIYGAASFIGSVLFLFLLIRHTIESKRYRARFASKKRGIR